MTFWWIWWKCHWTKQIDTQNRPHYCYFSNHFFLIMQNKHLSFLSSGWPLGPSWCECIPKWDPSPWKERKKEKTSCRFKLNLSKSIHFSNAPLGLYKIHTVQQISVGLNSLSPAIIITIIIFVRSFFYFGQILLQSNPLSQPCTLRSHP